MALIVSVCSILGGLDYTIYQKKGTSHGYMTTQFPFILTGERVNLITTIIMKTAWQCGEVLWLATGMTTVAKHGTNMSARKMLVSELYWIALSASNH